ncbi:MAG: glycoside hydrolase family 4 [Halodesulfurarchaeum sp.]
MTETHGLQTDGIDTDDVTITYIGGGSREWAPKLFRDLALSDLSGEVRLHDIDHESAELNAEFGNWIQDTQDVGTEWTYEAVADREEALAGADVVVLSTQYDPAETFVHDLDRPKEYGIYGAVAATIGPGGIFRAMRTIPVYREFAASIREQCPDAWVVNFTNPVHFVTRALYDEYPDINAIGFCHEVLWTRHHLASIVEEELGKAAERADISVNVKGINHFTWIDEARYKGRDLWPLLENLADSERANRVFTPADLADESPFTDKQQVTWELFRRFGLFPAAGDRHLVEYAPWFLAGGKETLNRWGVKRTDSDYRAKHWHPDESDQTTDVTAWMDGDREFELFHSNEVFDDIVAALGGDGEFVTNVNLPNRGQVDGVERGAVVETNAIVREGEIKPLTAGGFPRGVRTQIAGHVDTIESIIEASRDGDLDAAFAGFLLDPQIQRLPIDQARNLFAELVAAEEPYLRDWALDSSSVLARADAYDS